jgi:threonine/homoserine/homoserine lactone efflux protein
MAAIIAVTGLNCWRSRSADGTQAPVEPNAALFAGLIAGLAIAVQVGAVSLLLIETAIVAGPRVGVAAGLGVATADLGFAAVAAAAGGTAGAALASHEAEIRLVAAVALAAIAVHGLIALRPSGVAAADAGAPGLTSATRRGPAPTHYARFLAITAANPLTIASFAAVAASSSLGGVAAAAAFVAGVGVASAAWHVVLSLAAAHAGRRLTSRAQRGLAIGGRVGVLAIAAHLALAV